MFAASQRSKNIIKEYFGEALYMPRNFRAKSPSRSGRRDRDVAKLPLVSVTLVSPRASWC